MPDLSVLGGTIFIVGKQIDASDTNAPFISFGTSQSVNIRRAGASGDAIRFSVNSSGGTTINDRGSVIDNTFHTLRLRVNNVSQFVSVNNDSETVVACVLGSFAGGTPLELMYSGGTYGNKSIAELLVYTRSLTPTEITKVETYLKTKYAHY